MSYLDDDNESSILTFVIIGLIVTGNGIVAFGIVALAARGILRCFI